MVSRCRAIYKREHIHGYAFHSTIICTYREHRLLKCTRHREAREQWTIGDSVLNELIRSDWRMELQAASLPMRALKKQHGRPCYPRPPPVFGCSSRPVRNPRAQQRRHRNTDLADGNPIPRIPFAPFMTLVLFVSEIAENTWAGSVRPAIVAVSCPTGPDACVPVSESP